MVTVCVTFLFTFFFGPDYAKLILQQKNGESQLQHKLVLKKKKEKD